MKWLKKKLVKTKAKRNTALTESKPVHRFFQVYIAISLNPLLIKQYGVNKQFNLYGLLGKNDWNWEKNNKKYR